MIRFPFWLQLGQSAFCLCSLGVMNYVFKVCRKNATDEKIWTSSILNKRRGVWKANSEVRTDVIVLCAGSRVLAIPACVLHTLTFMTDTLCARRLLWRPPMHTKLKTERCVQNKVEASLQFMNVRDWMHAAQPCLGPEFSRSFFCPFSRFFPAETSKLGMGNAPMAPRSPDQQHE
ncbi:hypothetical protein B0H19DRAFT_406967 [Mycena capillaripes]|nr:hypothetical protein B0H19DRAFT_406967 [Mycena capillaripes]